MKEKKQEISFTEYANKSELPELDAHLIEEAEKATKNAHAPYSQFKVGAAIAFEDGSILTGNNQENAAYPSGLCAERVVLFYASSQHPQKIIKSIAVVAHSLKGNIDQTISPCGACRQVIAEYEAKQNSPIRIIFMKSQHGFYSCNSIHDLLPFSFNSTLL